jgi:hypothetical protein
LSHASASQIWMYINVISIGAIGNGTTPRNVHLRGRKGSTRPLGDERHGHQRSTNWWASAADKTVEGAYDRPCAGRSIQCRLR